MTRRRCTRLILFALGSLWVLFGVILLLLTVLLYFLQICIARRVRLRWEEETVEEETMRLGNRGNKTLHKNTSKKVKCIIGLFKELAMMTVTVRSLFGLSNMRKVFVLCPACIHSNAYVRNIKHVWHSLRCQGRLCDSWVKVWQFVTLDHRIPILFIWMTGGEAQWKEVNLKQTNITALMWTQLSVCQSTDDANVEVSAKKQSNSSWMGSKGIKEYLQITFTTSPTPTWNINVLKLCASQSSILSSQTQWLVYT